MKKLLLLAAVSLPFLHAQCPTGTAYPSALDTSATLTVAKNNIATTITSAQQSTDTVLIVASTSGWTADMMATVDTGGSLEVEFVTGVSGNNVLEVSRGCESTTAVAHAAGAGVANNATAYSGHTGLMDAVLAVEDLLGPEAQNIVSATSVRSFGALCDGVTDDTTALQNAYNAMGANGWLYQPVNCVGDLGITMTNSAEAGDVEPAYDTTNNANLTALDFGFVSRLDNVAFRGSTIWSVSNGNLVKVVTSGTTTTVTLSSSSLLTGFEAGDIFTLSGIYGTNYDAITLNGNWGMTGVTGATFTFTNSDYTPDGTYTDSTLVVIPLTKGGVGISGNAMARFADYITSYGTPQGANGIAGAETLMTGSGTGLAVYKLGEFRPAGWEDWTSGGGFYNGLINSSSDGADLLFQASGGACYPGSYQYAVQAWQRSNSTMTSIVETSATTINVNLSIPSNATVHMLFLITGATADPLLNNTWWYVDSIGADQVEATMLGPGAVSGSGTYTESTLAAQTMYGCSDPNMSIAFYEQAISPFQNGFISEEYGVNNAGSAAYNNPDFANTWSYAIASAYGRLDQPVRFLRAGFTRQGSPYGWRGSIDGTPAGNNADSNGVGSLLTGVQHSGTTLYTLADSSSPLQVSDTMQSPAGFMGSAGRRWRLKAAGKYSTANGSDTLALSFTGIGNTITLTTPAGAATGNAFQIEWTVSVVTPGTSGTCLYTVEWRINGIPPITAASDSTCNTTSTSGYTIVGQWSAANSGDTLTMYPAYTEVID
jgi:hypothetical protein